MLLCVYGHSCEHGLCRGFEGVSVGVLDCMYVFCCSVHGLVLGRGHARLLMGVCVVWTWVQCEHGHGCVGYCMAMGIGMGLFLLGWAQAHVWALACACER